MPTVDFYKNLGYDFYQYEDEEELRGLTPGGFNGGDNSLNVKDFNDLEPVSYTHLTLPTIA